MWIVGALCGAFIFLIGLNKFYKMKTAKQFYEDFSNFLNVTEPKICFFQNKTDELFVSSGYKTEFAFLIDSYKHSLLNDNSDVFENWFKTQDFLNRDDAFVIKKFLENFGRVDAEQQVKSIQNLKQFVLGKIDSENNRLKTSGKLCLNLSAMLGLVVFILIL